VASTGIPIGLGLENAVSVINVLDQSQRNAERLGGSVNVVLHNNSLSETARCNALDPDTAAKRSQVIEGAIRDIASQLPHLNVFSVNRQYPLLRLPNMCLVRAEKMEVVAAIGRLCNYDPEHMVMWLDADTVSVADDTLLNISKAMAAEDSFLFHANIEYDVGELFTSEDPIEASVALAAVYGATKNWLLGGLHPTANHGYPEEWGLAFRLGDYLRVGGVNPKDHHLHGRGESRSLRTNVLRELKQDGIYYVPDTFVVASLRRIEALAKIIPASRIGTQEFEIDYQLYSELQPWLDKFTDPITISFAGAMAMVDALCKGYADISSDAKLSDEQAIAIGAIISQMFPVRSAGFDEWQAATRLRHFTRGY
jgi:hypothetical protein